MKLLSTLWRSTIGMKVVMALTGLMLFAFVIGHLVGNLQIFIPDKGVRINNYAKFLHSNPGLLWGSRIGLLLAVLAHVATAVRLTALNRQARPVPYIVKDWRRADTPARTMLLSGIIVGLFVVYHLLHFTAGKMHAGLLQPLRDNPHVMDVHHNVTASFGVWYIVFFYIAAQLALGLHLSHGVSSLFQSLGLNHPRYTPLITAAGRIIAGGITLGNIAIPAAVFLGIVK